MELKQIKNTPVDSNCYVLFDKIIGSECVVIDPGSELDESLLEFMSAGKIIPKYVFLTHEHFDHCWGVNMLRAKFPQIILVCSKECSKAIQDKKRNHSVFFQQPGFEISKAEITTEEVEFFLEWFGEEIRFYPALGHTSAGMIIKCGSFLFTGDELIQDTKTVTKLKTGSMEKLYQSLSFFNSMKGKGLIVCPGHGDVFELDSYDLNKILAK